MMDWMKVGIHGLINGLSMLTGLSFAHRILQGYFWQEILSVVVFVFLTEVLVSRFFPALRRVAQ